MLLTGRALCLIGVLFGAVEADQCIPFTPAEIGPMCGDIIGYKGVWMPSGTGHHLFDAIGQEIDQFWPLVEIACSTSLRPYLCLSYYPPCKIGDTTKAPVCRELCEAAHDGCSPIMIDYGFALPEKLSCERLPAFADGHTCHNATSRVPVITSMREDRGEVEEPTPPAAASASAGGTTSAPEPSREAKDAAGCLPLPEIPRLAEVASALVSYLASAERLQRLQENTLMLEQEQLHLQNRLLLHQLGGF